MKINNLLHNQKNTHYNSSPRTQKKKKKKLKENEKVEIFYKKNRRDYLVTRLVTDDDKHGTMSKFNTVFNQSPDTLVYLLPHSHTPTFCFLTLCPKQHLMNTQLSAVLCKTILRQTHVLFFSSDRFKT